MLKAKGLKDQGELHKMASVLKGKRRSTEQSKQYSLRIEMQIVVRYLIQLGHNSQVSKRAYFWAAAPKSG